MSAPLAIPVRTPSSTPFSSPLSAQGGAPGLPAGLNALGSLGALDPDAPTSAGAAAAQTPGGFSQALREASRSQAPEQGEPSLKEETSAPSTPATQEPPATGPEGQASEAASSAISAQAEPSGGPPGEPASRASVQEATDAKSAGGGPMSPSELADWIARLLPPQAADAAREVAAQGRLHAAQARTETQQPEQIPALHSASPEEQGGGEEASLKLARPEEALASSGPGPEVQPATPLALAAIDTLPAPNREAVAPGAQKADAVPPAQEGALPARAHGQAKAANPQAPQVLDARAVPAPSPEEAAKPGPGTPEPTSGAGRAELRESSPATWQAAVSAQVNSRGAPQEAAAAVQTTVRTPVEVPGFVPAFSARVAVLVREGVEMARVHLNPAEMGPVAVQISREGKQVRVDLVAEVAATRSLLEQSLPALAGALREGGFTLSGGGVFQGSGSNAGQTAAGLADAWGQAGTGEGHGNGRESATRGHAFGRGEQSLEPGLAGSAPRWRAPVGLIDEFA